MKQHLGIRPCSRNRMKNGCEWSGLPVLGAVSVSSPAMPLGEKMQTILLYNKSLDRQPPEEREWNLKKLRALYGLT
jgi:hypothetical protein